MRTRCWSIGICLLLVPKPSSAEIHWDLLESSAERLVLELRVDGGALEAGPQDEQHSYQRVRLPGAIDGGESGLPMLPHALRWALLPPDGDASLRILELEFEELGRARLMPRPEKGELIEGPRPGMPVTSERLAEAEGYASFKSDARRVIELGEPVWMARQHMIPVRVSPIVYDAASQRVQILRKARVEIRFRGGEGPSMAPALGRSPSTVVRQTLNPAMARSWSGLPATARARQERWQKSLEGVHAPSPKKAAGVIPFDAGLLESNEIRLRVPATRLWQVPVGALLQLHGIPLDTPRSHLRLYQRRMSDPDDARYPGVLTVDVPFFVYGDPDPAQNVSSTDAILFYGFAAADERLARDVDGESFPGAMEELPENYNSDNCYFLALVDPGAGSWARLTRAPMSPSGGSPQASFAVLDHFEKDQGYQDNPKRTSEPRYHWNNANATSVEAALDLRVPLPGTQFAIAATLTRSPVFGGAVRNIEISLVDDQNSQLLETIDVSGTLFASLQTRSWTVDADAWQYGSLRLRLNRDTQNSLLSTYLGSVEVGYEALYTARNNRFEFDTGQSGGDVDVEVKGFRTNSLMLMEITDPRAPRWIDLGAGNTVDLGGGDWTLSLHVPQLAGEKRRFSVLPYLAAPEILINNDTELDRVPDVLTATGPAQVLVIGPAEFETAAAEWLQWRRDHDSNGWIFEYVDVQQIYDDFSGGLKDPGAIKEFLLYYHLMHEARAVLFAGDGNENARELGANSSRDIIPPSLHVQTVSSFDELLASDKWFVTFDLAETGILNNYPRQLNKGPDMLIGRLPVNSAADLQTQIAKIKAYEQPTAAQLWRGKTLWIADDAYSTDVIGAGQGCYSRRSIEGEFVASQQISAQCVTESLDGAISAEVWDITDVTDGLRVAIDATCYDLGRTRANANSVFPSLTNARLSEGWLWVSYQGHANFDVLAHENVVLLQWLSSLNNQGRPFLFFGMGCHVTDFLRAREAAEGKTIGEALLNRSSGGAIATYGSSGFEYLSPNSAYMKLIACNFFDSPRQTSSVLDADEFGSPWIFAEAMAQSELDIVTLFGPSTVYREMMAQYNLLGDPLLRIDALPARVAAQAGGATIADGAVLATTGNDRSIFFEMGITDETGLGQVQVLDIEADADLSDGIQPNEILRTHSPGLQLDPVAGEPRVRAAQIQLPIVAQDYKVALEVYDGSYPDARPARMLFDVPMPLILFVDGEEVADLTGVAAGTSVEVRVEFEPPIALLESEIELRVTGGSASALNLVDLSADGRSWQLTFTLLAASDEQLLELDLAGTVTELGRRAGGGGSGELAFRAHYPFPNPTSGAVRFVAEVSRAVQSVDLRVFDLTGRPVFHLREPVAVDPNNRFVLEWDGRDKMGDELANGVYLYRLEARGGGASARSEMGRLVFMR